ncbi:hypothetical protein FRB96_006190 [Tulasnella sp. 330]|nr:hypothetical protein FRB96_006190 [Tulasnella sp. 330]KAG8877220.1 hypothetical protein FRB97_003570 [Tulasnella sp. 331]
MAEVFNPSASQRIIAVLKASRPPGWTFGPILFGIGIIHSRIFPQTKGELLRALLQIGSLSLPLCIIVFGMNDVYDYDSDLLNPRKAEGSLEGTILNPVYHHDVRVAAWASTALILSCSLLTQQPENVIATASLVFLGWQYSARPLRLKEVPIVDSVSNGLIVLLASFVGLSFGGASVVDAPSKGYAMALVCSGVHALGAVVDVDADVAAGQKTIATFLGRRATAMFATSTYAIGVASEGWDSVFGAYLMGGLFITLAPVFKVGWAHRAFQIVVCWTVIMAMIWFGVQARGVLNKVLK